MIDRFPDPFELIDNPFPNITHHTLKRKRGIIHFIKYQISIHRLRRWGKK